MSARRALPGPTIDLLTNGVRGPSLTRSEVVKAARKVMMSAHRNGWTYEQLHPLITDTKKRRLAEQIATGKGGRTYAPRLREEFLRKHWEQTGKVVASTPVRDAEEVREFLEFVRDALNGETELPERLHAVMDAVIDLADHYGTAKVAVPVRSIVDGLERRGFDVSRGTAHNDLMRLCRSGYWLAIAQRGDRYRASLYHLAPAVAEDWTYMRAKAHESKGVPTSKRTYVQPEQADEGEHEMTSGTATLTMTLSPDELRVLAEYRARLAEQHPASGNVVPIRPEATA